LNYYLYIKIVSKKYHTVKYNWVRAVKENNVFAGAAIITDWSVSTFALVSFNPAPLMPTAITDRSVYTHVLRTFPSVPVPVMPTADTYGENKPKRPRITSGIETDQSRR
jgi:hypothetical protein